MMLHEWNSRAAILTITLLALAGIGVGKPTVSTSNQSTACSSTCNMRQGYCQPNGQCTCYAGWEGSNCDQCTLAVGCVHGTCDQPWQCNCKEGYSGRHCQLDLQFCERHQPCHNDATCVNDGTGSYVCLCPAGFSGKNCDLKDLPPVPTKASEPFCLNGGTCSFGNDAVGCEKCTCPKGFAGDRCEARVWMCVTRPCANGGRCIDLVGDFRCQCTEGYVGRYCTEDVNECAILGDNACRNGGKCINRRGSYRCSCPEGFQGSRCDKQVLRYTTTPTTPTTTTTLTSTTTPKPSPETQPSIQDESPFDMVLKNTPDLVKPSIGKAETKKTQQSSTNIKVTHILRQVEVKSSNSDTSFVKGVMEGSKIIMPESPPAEEASVSVVQAVTFAFLGVAAALFVGIGVFLWLYCSKRERRANCCGGSSGTAEESKSKPDRHSNRLSLLIDDDASGISSVNRSIVKKGCKPGLAVRTAAPSTGATSKLVKLRPPVDCLYVALPQDIVTSSDRTSSLCETNVLLDASKLSQSSMSYRH